MAPGATLCSQRDAEGGGGGRMAAASSAYCVAGYDTWGVAANRSMDSLICRAKSTYTPRLAFL